MSKKSQLTAASIITKASSKRSDFMRKTHEIMNRKTGEKFYLSADVLILLEQLSRDMDLDKLSDEQLDLLDSIDFDTLQELDVE